MHNVLRLPQVLKKTGLGKSTVYKQIAIGEFPKPILLSANAVGWIERDIDDWIEMKIKQSANDNKPLATTEHEW